MKIIAELGLRYRPAVAADLIAHTHLIGLLTNDVAHIEPSVLDQAARKWVSTKAFMPKASELIALAAEIIKRRAELRNDDGLDPFESANRRLEGTGKRWVNGSLTSTTPARQRRNGDVRPDPRTPLSTDEIELIRNGNSMQRGVFDMGLNAGWIVLGSDGIYRDSASAWV